jgi:[protein-PII] uridylyltransferase
MPSRLRTPLPPRERERRAERSLDPAAFRASMPLEYRDAFDEAAAREHASIVGRRAGAPAHGEVWRHLPEGRAIVCLVADDRPGLLSFVSAALAEANMDVLSVQAYTRRQPGAQVPEAVDFVWLRREDDATAQIGSADTARIVRLLLGMIGGDLAPESLLRQAPPRGPLPLGVSRVGFAGNLDAGHAVLTVEASDRPGLLLAVTLALFRAGVQIIGSRADTKDGSATDRFTIAECDGARLSPQRREEARAAVHAALETLAYRPR